MCVNFHCLTHEKSQECRPRNIHLIKQKQSLTICQSKAVEQMNDCIIFAFTWIFLYMISIFIWNWNKKEGVGQPASHSDFYTVGCAFSLLPQREKLSLQRNSGAADKWIPTLSTTSVPGYLKKKKQYYSWIISHTLSRCYQKWIKTPIQYTFFNLENTLSSIACFNLPRVPYDRSHSLSVDSSHLFEKRFNDL